MIPKRYEKARYSDVPSAVRGQFTQLREKRKGIYLHGPVGTGKTHIAYALKAEWDRLNPHRPAIFWNTTDLMQSIRDDFDRHAYDKTHSAKRIIESRALLFLDDFGTEKPTEWVLERIYNIINHRYNTMMPMVITSNLSIDEVGSQFGDRIASRLVEMCEIFELDGEDRRLGGNRGVSDISDEKPV